MKLANNHVYWCMAGGDIEDATPLKVQGQSSGSVLPYVGVACLGAILFGYHLGYDDIILIEEHSFTVILPYICYHSCRSIKVRVSTGLVCFTHRLEVDSECWFGPTP